MKIKTDPIADVSAKNTEIVTWNENYATGIGLIDDQHRRLVTLTNELYHACLSGNEAAGTVFKNALHHMVEYVRFHFGAEMEILERVKFPMSLDHKKQHDAMVKNILDAAKDYNEGKKFVPNTFVRTLKDWVFGHIALSDKSYAAYVAEQKEKGLLSEEQING